MSATTYTVYELRRTLRNRRFSVFSLIFPLVLFFIIAGSNKTQQISGIPFPLYYMAGMAAWGTMMAIVASGAPIAAERSIGWTRQMRLTPLSTFAYFRAKVFAAYLMAAITIALLYLAAMSLGVRLPAREWLTMTGLLVVGLIPFTLVGILLGHLLTVDSIGPAMGGVTTLFALLGGSWGPLASGGVLHAIGESLPSYWLVEAGKTALGGSVWPVLGWMVVATWTAALACLAMWAYRRDNGRS